MNGGERSDRWASERAVIVTGAAGGLGRAHALAAAELGVHVYTADVVDVAATVDAIGAAGGVATSCHLDITDAGQWEALVGVVAADGRRLAGLVNNAGVSLRRGFAGTSPDAWRRVIEINLTGAFLGIRTVAPVMAQLGGGSIVNISSIAGTIGYFSPAYGASKWGLIGLSKSAAGEWADRAVRVNSVLPGVVDTPLLSGAETLIAATLRSVPAGRAARPEEIARVVRFLLSDDAEYISGAEFVIDGAWTSNGLYKRIIADLPGGLEQSEVRRA